MQEEQTSSPVVLEAISLGKHFGQKLALEPLAFQLHAGECLGIAGHNGSGKSTLLSLMAQTLRPDSGQILHGGKDVLGDRAFLRSHVGYIPQQDGLLEDLTVDETLRAWQSLFDIPDDGTLGDAVERLGLAAFRSKRISTLSGGMKKRVSIALALLNRPDILIMDEVSAALDRKYSQSLSDFLSEFTKLGGSVLFCSHQKEELINLCHTLLILRNGRVVFYGRPGELPQDEAECDSLFYLGQHRTKHSSGKCGKIDT